MIVRVRLNANLAPPPKRRDRLGRPVEAAGSLRRQVWLWGLASAGYLSGMMVYTHWLR